MQAIVNPPGWQWPLLVVVLWGTGCADDATCDPDQELVDGTCKMIEADDGSGGTRGTGGSGGSGGGAGDSGTQIAGAAGESSCDVEFGDACTDDSDCGCEAPLCATLPGNFLCTNTCDDDPNVCPEGFVCEDLSRFGDFPSTCFPEGALSF